MRELIQFEVNKLLRKPLVWVMLAGTVLFMVVMEYSWVIPGLAGVQEEVNGQRVILKGVEGIRRNKEIAALFYGPVTDEKIQTIIETYDMPDSFWEAYSLAPDRERNYAHNLIYDTLSSYGFTNMDGSYSGTTVEEVFDNLAPDIVLGYSTGWECTVYLLIYTFLTWGCVIVIIVSPVFSEEYTKHMDALILTGSSGRKQCTEAKVIASFLVAVAGSVIIIAAATLLMLAAHGTTGYDASVQLAELGIFKNTPYILTWRQAYGLACIAWFGGILVLTSIVLVVSALAKSSFSALVIAFSIYVIPLFLPWYIFPKWLELAGYLLPITQMQLLRLFPQDLLSVGGLAFPPVYLALPVTLLALLIGIPWAKRSFANHQVA